MSCNRQPKHQGDNSSGSSNSSTDTDNDHDFNDDASMEIDVENQEQERQEHNHQQQNQQQQQRHSHHHNHQHHYEEDDALLLLERPAELESAHNGGSGNISRQMKTIICFIFKCTLLLVIFALIIILLFRRLDFVSSSTSSILPSSHDPPSSSSSTSSLKNYTPYDIYCTGPLLHTVQLMTNNHTDSKEFVDRPMKVDANQIMEAFHTLPDSTSVDEIIKFLDIYFDPAGSDLQPVTPTDYQERPKQLHDSITNNETLREWAMELNAFWKVLGRQQQSQQQYPHYHSSLLPTKHLLVVPGGRFRESYYWDTYWIVHGLLASGMYETAKGVVQNLLDFVESYGFVPNGGRLYYLTRSQPPMLSDMIRILHQYKPDLEFLKSATRTLDKEYQYWMTQHAINVEKGGHVHTLNRYISKATEPRPESYREDVLTAQRAAQNNNRSKNKTYSEIIAACESGWDFSSRWLRDQHNLETVMTSNVIPVDLNTMMHRMEKNMIQFHSILEINITKQVNKYKQAAEKRIKAFEHVLWDASTYMWRDYWIDEKEWSPIVSSSNFFPLWSGSFLDQSNTTLLENIQNSLMDSGLIQAGGVLTTTQVTGQQWDKPNAFSPIQDILIEGLLQYETTRELGERLIQIWIRENFISYTTGGHHMFEKYDALYINGTAGFGGEYSIQVGFGWTNGVVLKLLSSHASLLNDL